METLISLADPNRSHLLLPKLGEAVEPVQRREMSPWWRGAEGMGKVEVSEVEPVDSSGEDRLAGAVPWPLD